MPMGKGTYGSKRGRPSAAGKKAMMKKMTPAQKKKNDGYEKEEKIMAKKKTKSKVNQAGNYTKPTMRKRLFNKIKAGSKGGKPGQWSARKAQMLAREYKSAGGGYK